MFGLLRRVGWIGGLAALARTPAGRSVVGKVKAYAADPDNRRQLTNLATELTGKKPASPRR